MAALIAGGSASALAEPAPLSEPRAASPAATLAGDSVGGHAPPPLKPSAVVTGPSRRGRLSGVRESDEAYPTIVRSRDLRVVECRDRLQWILQRRTPTQWAAVSYHRDRAALIARFGSPAPELEALPAYHHGGAP